MKVAEKTRNTGMSLRRALFGGSGWLGFWFKRIFLKPHDTSIGLAISRALDYPPILDDNNSIEKITLKDLKK